MLEATEQKTTLHISCGACHASAIFFVSGNQAGVLSMGMATDLDKEEAKQKFLRCAVTADEVIDAHQFVSGQKVYMDELIGKSR